MFYLPIIIALYFLVVYLIYRCMKKTKKANNSASQEVSKVSKIVTVKVTKVESPATKLAVSSMLQSDNNNEVELAFEVESLEGEIFDEESFIQSVAASTLGEAIDEIQQTENISDDTIEKMQQAYQQYIEDVQEQAEDKSWTPEIDLDSYEFPDELVIEQDEEP